MSAYQYTDPHSSLDAYEDEGKGNTELHDLLIELDILPGENDDKNNDDYKHLQYVNDNDKRDIIVSDSDLSDDEFIDSLIQQRLQFNHNTQHTKHVDYVEHITADLFQSDVIDASSNSNLVLLLVYTDTHIQSIDSNTVFLECVKQFSVQYMNIKCVAMKHSIALSNVDSIDCPIILIYRNGCKYKQYNTLQFNGINTDIDCMCYILGRDGIIDTDIVNDPRHTNITRVNKTINKSSAARRSTHRSSRYDIDDSSDDG